ncbi:MAG: PepSY domain-containing protein [Gemmatimonadota bacterium]
MRHFIRGVTLLVVVSLIPCALAAQEREARELSLKAKVSRESARAVALRQVPGGTVQAAELQIEDGILVHIFDITVPRREGLEEVVVSAVDGSVVAVRHVGPRAPGGRS